MKEIILNNKKNGMAMLLAFIGLYLLAIFGIIFGGATGGAGFILMVLGIVWCAVGWIPFLGLKVLKPQEALVLTLFGKYVGTLKEAGFYFVNPFCVAVNPAAKTKLNQSGDVDGGNNKNALLQVALGKSADMSELEMASKKISLKAMTLSNSRQKINDALGNPIEIGIAVIWRVTDTAKAVFNVDNYKEYLSLQCDSALRDIVRIYPYDVAPGVDTTGDGVADEGSLRGSSETVAKRIRDEIQQKVEEAGIEVRASAAPWSWTRSGRPPWSPTSLWCSAATGTPSLWSTPAACIDALWPTTRRNRCRCACPPSSMTPLSPGRRTTSAPSTGRSSIC